MCFPSNCDISLSKMRKVALKAEMKAEEPMTIDCAREFALSQSAHGFSPNSKAMFATSQYYTLAS